MLKITKVEPKENHKLWIRFSDGLAGEVDLTELVGKGVFAKLKDPKYFAKVAIDPETHTVCWPGGVDLAPDALYEDIQKSSAKHRAA